MSEPAIRVEKLGKQYNLGLREKRHASFRQALVGAVKAPLDRFRRLSGKVAEGETFWALKDVSFDVQPGEVIGIVGRNGAGKSTLLKVLSQITEPTTGRVELNGRVASLLEVGTGFHAELTGRENIFLNGSMLGMSRKEIARKFDEITAFAEIDRFLDTPVKRYSSGMYVRLAFAVAAHLEPEILVVDEVLAVGDVAFQKKCLGKMQSVGRDGRTVLFVSHNMDAVKSLCSQAILLRSGSVAARGSVESITESYLASSPHPVVHVVRWETNERPGTDLVKLSAMRVLSGTSTSPHFGTGSELQIELEFELTRLARELCVGFDLLDSQGRTVLRSYQTDTPSADWPALTVGTNILQCQLPRDLLNAGKYYVCPRISIHNVEWLVHLDPVLQFALTLDHGKSPLWMGMSAIGRPGIITPVLKWERI